MGPLFCHQLDRGFVASQEHTPPLLEQGTSLVAALARRTTLRFGSSAAVHSHCY